MCKNNTQDTYMVKMDMRRGEGGGGGGLSNGAIYWESHRKPTQV